jgi:hypothetical protein
METARLFVAAVGADGRKKRRLLKMDLPSSVSDQNSCVDCAPQPQSIGSLIDNERDCTTIQHQ